MGDSSSKSDVDSKIVVSSEDSPSIENWLLSSSQEADVDNKRIEDTSIEIDKYTVGKWDIEVTNKDMLIYGNKDYLILFQNKLIKQKLKGISLKNVMLQEENKIFTIKQWQGFSYALKTNCLEHQIIKNIKKSLSREYTKGIVTTPEIKQKLKYTDNDKEIQTEYIQSDIISYKYPINIT